MAPRGPPLVPSFAPMLKLEICLKRESKSMRQSFELRAKNSLLPGLSLSFIVFPT